MENKTVTFYGDDFILETWVDADTDVDAIAIASETLDEQLGWDVGAVANDVRVEINKYYRGVISPIISTTPAPKADS